MNDEDYDYDESGEVADAPIAPPSSDPETLLIRLRDLVDEARQMPLSASVMINREEFAELIDAILEALPAELRDARWLLRDRDEVKARAEREAAQILEAAKVQAGRMVERTEVVREAQAVATRILDEATDDANRLQNEAEDYIDQKLAAFEVVLQRTISTVQSGRDRLSVHTTSPQLDETDAAEAESDFFDQDLT